MIIGIHQPNYAPWLGYFHKIAKSDVFIFLDDVAFSKGSVINRVKVLDNGQPSWLTVPAKPKLGTPINQVAPGQADWPARHLSKLRNAYRQADFFSTCWPEIEMLYASLDGLSLCEANETIIRRLCTILELNAGFLRSSEIPKPDDLNSDDLLIELVKHAAPTPTYLSGSGGRKYQDEDKFRAAGVTLEYTGFSPAAYPQTAEPFAAGLSVLDAALNVGWDGVRTLIGATDRRSQ